MNQFQPVFKNSHTRLDHALIEADTRSWFRFRKTYDYVGLWADEYHRELTDAVRHDGLIDIGIHGWLFLPNALKLYELARFVPGDVLNVGTFKGLSARIAYEACLRSGRDFEIISTDTDVATTLEAKAMFEPLERASKVHLFNVEASEFARNLAAAERRFDLVFVDHSHRQDAVFAICAHAEGVVNEGGFILFNDYNDPRNVDTTNDDYGVFQAVSEGLPQDRFEFYGVFGSSGLFRKRPYSAAST